MQPNPDEVKRLFDFLEFRTFAERLGRGARAGGRRALGRRAPAARRRGHRERVRRRRRRQLLGVARRRSTSPPSWDGEPGRGALRGLAVVTDADAAAVDVDPGRPPRRSGASPPRSSAAAVRGHDAKPLMRSLLQLGIDLDGLELDTAIAAYLLDPAEARYELPHLVERYTRFAAPADEPAAKGQLDLDGTQADPATSAGRQALAVHHLVEPIADAASTSRAWPSCTARSRTRWCACWPGWSTPASPSTSPSCAALNERLTADVVAPRRRAASRSSGATTSTSTRRSSCASCSTPRRRPGAG